MGATPATVETRMWRELLTAQKVLRCRIAECVELLADVAEDEAVSQVLFESKDKGNGFRYVVVQWRTQSWEKSPVHGFGCQRKSGCIPQRKVVSNLQRNVDG